MNCDNELSEQARNYIERAKEIGKEKGDCHELSELCHLAYSEYRAGIMTTEEYSKIYAICADYAYPR